MSIEITLAATSLALTKPLIEALKTALSRRSSLSKDSNENYDQLVERLNALEKQITSGDTSKIEEVKLLVRDLQSKLPTDISEKIETDFTDVAYENLKDIQRERIRQAKMAFNVALGLMVIGILIIFTGIILLFLEKTSAGIVTSIVGTVTNVISFLTFRFSKEANDRLDQINQDLKIIEKTRWASKMIEEIDDPTIKNKAKAKLADAIKSENS